MDFNSSESVSALDVFMVQKDKSCVKSRAILGGVTGSVEGAATKLEGIVVNKAVNSELAHAAERAFERGFFSSVKDASSALRALSKEITANGLPAGTIRDSAHADRVLVPLKDGAYAVYQIAKKRNG